MKMITSLIPAGHPNRPGIKLERVDALVFHYTENDRPTADDAMNVRWIGRAYDFGKYWSGSAFATGKIEKGSLGKGPKGGGIPFRIGSAHVFCDMDSCTLAIPTDEVAWSCGDRNKPPFTMQYKAQQPIARDVFGFRQNYRTVNIEICNNDAIKNSTADWDAAVRNAIEWAKMYIAETGRVVDWVKSLHPQDTAVPFKPGSLLLLRHFDVSGKNCPAPLVDNFGDWQDLVYEVAGCK